MEVPSFFTRPPPSRKMNDDSEPGFETLLLACRYFSLSLILILIISFVGYAYYDRSEKWPAAGLLGTQRGKRGLATATEPYDVVVIGGGMFLMEVPSFFTRPPSRKTNDEPGFETLLPACRYFSLSLILILIISFLGYAYYDRSENGQPHDYWDFKEEKEV
jgi:hypothetical protein